MCSDPVAEELSGFAVRPRRSPELRARLLLCAVSLFGVLGSSLPADARAAQLEAAAPYDLEVVEQALPSTLDSRSETTVHLTLRNQGSATWSPAQNFHVSYHWLTPAGKAVIWDGTRTTLPGKVPPGADSSVDARLATPPDAGEYLLQWDVVQEGVVWISQQDPTPQKPITVRILQAAVTHAFTIVAQSAPDIMWTGQRRPVSMILRNDGTRSWTPQLPINVSYHWRSRDGAPVVFDGLRSPIPSDVPPGGQVRVDVALEAPDSPGRYRLQWDMVEENVCWFADRDPTPEPAISIVVLPHPSPGRHGATVVAVVLLGLAIVARRRDAVPPALASVVSISDVVWMGLALWLKQRLLLDEMGILPDSGSAWVVLGGVGLIGLAVSCVPHKVRPWTAWVVNAFASLLILTDVIHERFFGDVVSLISIGAANQTGDVTASIASLLRGRDIWLFIDLVPGGLLALLVARAAARPGRRPLRYLAAPLGALVIAGALSLGLNRSTEEASFEQVFKSAFVVQRLGAVNYHAWDAWGYLRTRFLHAPLTEARRTELTSWFASHESQRAGRGPWFGAASGKNLLMIQVESMQGFVLGYMIDGQEVTPNLDRWKARSAWFSAVTDQTAQGRTSDSEFATQVSLLPPVRGAAAFRFAGSHFHGIADILRRRGYTTISAVPFDGNFWNRRATHPAYGFSTSLFDKEFAPGPVVGWGLNDRDFLRQMVPRLSSMRRPYCALLITLSNHHPFSEFPDELKELKLGPLEGTSFGNYLHSMHLFDKAFGELIDGLDKAGELDDTVIAVWGDHAAGFEWNEAFAKTLGIRWTEPSYYLADRVPLMISVPGAEGLVGEKTIRAGQIDVAPTLLALLGVDPAPYAFLGRNLFGEPGDAPVTQRYGAWMNAGHMYITGGPDLREGYCFDVASKRALPLEACRKENEAATSEIEVSRGVLRWDLQEEIHESLSGAQAGAVKGN